jgi:hypothetical protein
MECGGAEAMCTLCSALQMGVTIIRSGGSVSQAFRWKDWRQPPHYRASAGLVWGDSLVAGWGPFEVRPTLSA